jgi:hypothetical protein
VHGRAAASLAMEEEAAVAARFRLPVSGIQIAMCYPTGADDVLLAEADVDDAALGLTVARRLGRTEPDIDWAALTPSDLDVLIVRLRQALYGNRIVAETTCRMPACDSAIDMSFTVEAYLTSHRPRSAPLRGRGWAVEACTDEPGWFRLRAADAEPAVRFRLPSTSDQLSVVGRDDAEQALSRLCIRPAGLPTRLHARVETAMTAMAPPLDSELQGVCPECGGVVKARFKARRYCLQEMRDRARFVYDDIDVLARHYHWSERAILTMPNPRRVNYAERARLAGRV